MARVKYFDGPCLTIYFRFYNLQRYKLPVSGLVDSATAMNQKDKNLEKSIFVHFNMTFLTTLTGI